MKKLSNLLSDYQTKKNKGYVTKEFQDYGYRLAMEMGEPKKTSLFIKLAKETNRHLLEQARSFVLDAYSAKNRGKLFMWKLKQLKDAKKEMVKKD